MKNFLVLFNKNINYVNSYKELFKKDLHIISERFTALKILFLPFRATIIIEDIHIYWYLYFIRLDLILIHVPRGGCTFKMGWKDSNVSLRIKFKLWRRNKVVVASDFFSDFFSKQDFMLKYQKLIVCAEPILEVNINKQVQKPDKTLLMLGDRAEKNDYLKVLAHIPTSFKNNLIITIHPRLNFKIENFQSSYDICEIKNVISDGSISSILMFNQLGANTFVIQDELFSRPLWNKKSEFYTNMIPLSNLTTALNNEETTSLNFNVSTKSLKSEI